MHTVVVVPGLGDVLGALLVHRRTSDGGDDAQRKKLQLQNFQRSGNMALVAVLVAACAALASASPAPLIAWSSIPRSAPHAQRVL